MKLLDAYKKLTSFSQPFLQSTDVAAILGVPRGHASKILNRLSESGLITPLNKGHWAIDPRADRFLIPEFLTAPSPSYISLQSALFFHGMISQIPEVIYAVSTSRARLYKTQLGTFSIHHLEASLFFGFETIGASGIKMATPEKALFDFLYLSPARSRIFHRLPEIELPKGFNKKLVVEMAFRTESKSRQTLVEAKLREILKFA